MKTINTLAILAFLCTLAAYFLSAGTPVAPAESGGDRTALDLLPPRRQAAPLKAEVAPAPKPKAEPNPMLEAVTSGNVCAVEAIKAKSYSYGGIDKNDLVALSAGMNAGPELAEFLSLDGPLAGPADTNKKFSTKAGKLFFALRFAGLSTITPAPENLPEARKRLLELEKEDPSNSALPFFRLGVEKKMNFEAKALAETEAKISSGSDFDTYLDELSKEFSRSRWQSPAVYRLSEHISYYALPSLNSYDGLNALKLSTTLSESDREHIAALMKQRALQSNNPILGRDYNAEFYEVGRDLAQDYQNPSIYQISVERVAAQGIEPLNFPYFDGGPDCDSRAYEEYFYRHR